MEEQKLNRKLAGWAEIEPVRIVNLTESLDACFKWLVPKLGLCDIQLSYRYDNNYYCHVTTNSIKPFESDSGGVACASAALAFCLAVSQLLDKET